jgi:hypothetical protein
MMTSQTLFLQSLVANTNPAHPPPNYLKLIEGKADPEPEPEEETGPDGPQVTEVE